MSFRIKLQFFLVKRLEISNKEAQSLLIEKKVFINGVPTSANINIEPEDEIRVENEVIQHPRTFKYIAFYKPRGIETTLNKSIENNIQEILPFDDIFHVGRLDKASEGLLILTDDGRIYDKVLRNENKVEKEYVVKVDKPIDTNFLEKMGSGVQILGKTTLPCSISAVDDFTFKIILDQGLNRQIRRMCYKLGFEVTYLCRVRIGNVFLGDLKPGEWRNLNRAEILKNQ